MARTGRPPKPLEEHRKTGTYRADRHSKQQVVVALPMAVGVPSPPDGVEFGIAGQTMWRQVWTSGALWVSPLTDGFTVVELCHIADNLAVARDRYRATREPGDLKVVLLASKALVDALSVLGFNPTARSRLGVAEVRAMSKLEDLRVKRTKRETGAG